jgi:hypothetical protein
MKSKLVRILDLVNNMGLRYVGFRIRHELLRRSGLLKSRFPAAPPFRQYITFQQWQSSPGRFFFHGKAGIYIPRHPSPVLEKTFQNISEGKLLLFSSVLTDLGKDYDWVTNPDSGHKYDAHKHWTEIADYSKTAGDIKYVWEKSRFSYLYDIIRYDYHHGADCADMVFADITSWIKSNPINCGPNYRCSQEMSLRVLNWTFALYYYRDAPALTEQVFNEMQHAIYWHLHHIYNNISFSRIAVRNNHAITETLTLYLAGLLYPMMPGAAEWKQKGKAWFEEEIAYQIYEDGTFLQYSMNYHRIVVQLLTWGIVLSEKNDERFSEVVYDRARRSVAFLRTCMVDESGWLPNYGANDGALFFRLSETHYRDYRPQLQALAAALGMDAGVEVAFEDKGWYGIDKPITQIWRAADGAHSFKNGGYYIIREPETLTFIKCGSYKDRPSQADNLHMDVWYKGENILIDAGSYKYNTDDATIRYFSGTRSHNTVMLGDSDQMLKGGRFIWYFWTQCKNAALVEDATSFNFEGTINAFKYIDSNIVHKRTIIKQKGAPIWKISDEILGAPADLPLNQHWHTPVKSDAAILISAKSPATQNLQPTLTDGWASSLYGQKEKTVATTFTTTERIISTEVTLK